MGQSYRHGRYKDRGTVLGGRPGLKSLSGHFLYTETLLLKEVHTLLVQIGRIVLQEQRAALTHTSIS